MKLPVDRKRTLKIFFIADAAFAVLLFLSCMNLFIFQKWNVTQIIIIALFVIISVFMLILSLTRNFYVIEKKYLVVVKGNKEYHYNYDDVVYIDKEQTERKKTLSFCMKEGIARYLPFDKDGKIYATFLNKCHNLMEYQEFRSKYPKVKL